MKFVSTTGRVFKVDIRPSRWPRKNRENSKSYFQWRVGQVINEFFQSEIILEEFYIPGENLYIDFFLPRKRIIIEAQGGQHFNYNKFFHGSKDGFRKSQERDSKKSIWCKHNSLRLIIIKEEDNEETIRSKLLSDNG